MLNKDAYHTLHFILNPEAEPTNNQGWETIPTVLATGGTAGT